jgi:hypothetical protein
MKYRTIKYLKKPKQTLLKEIMYEKDIVSASGKRGNKTY